MSRLLFIMELICRKDDRRTALFEALLGEQSSNNGEQREWNCKDLRPYFRLQVARTAGGIDRYELI